MMIIETQHIKKEKKKVKKNNVAGSGVKGNGALKSFQVGVKRLLKFCN